MPYKKSFIDFIVSTILVTHFQVKLEILNISNCSDVRCKLCKLFYTLKKKCPSSLIIYMTNNTRY